MSNGPTNELAYRLSKNYEKDQVSFRRPNRLGSYATRKSLNGKSMLENAEDYYSKYSLEQFKRLKRLDLKDGFEQRPDDRIMSSENHRIDELLRWIVMNKRLFLLNNEKLIDGKLNSLNTDFVSFRGVLTLLLNMSYDSKSQFAIHVEKFKGTHYLMLERFEDDEQIPIFCYAGRRFEVYCAKECSEEEKLKMNPLRKKNDATTGDSVQENIANEYEKNSTNELCFVYRSRLNDHSLVYGAEMDCFENIVKLHEPIDSDKIEGVELKTCKAVQSRGQEQTFKRYKTLKWYNQSFLSNMKKVTVGFWTDEHIVNCIKEYTLQDLVRMGDNSWSPELCLYQMDKMLAFIKRCFLKYEGTNRLKFIHLSFTHKLVCDDRDVQRVLPDFYKNEFN